MPLADPASAPPSWAPFKFVAADAIGEGQRLMSICNACRYCEGYCAVFPAMERRLEFSAADMGYLANLCHNCGACYTSCQYAPPHEYAVNLPRTLAEIRLATYAQSAWPSGTAGLFRDSVRNTVLLTLACIAIFLVGVFVAKAAPAPGAGATFYDVIPHPIMAATFGVVGIFVAIALCMMFMRFVRNTGGIAGGTLDFASIARASGDALSMKYLGGGGEGCASTGATPTTWRRRFHHLTAYGFLLCFAATVVATFYHYLLDLRAPYPIASVPVLLGVAGGIGLLVGTPGLWWLGQRRDPALADPRQAGMNMSFLLLLFLTSLTGLALLALRDSAAMAALLAIHLGVVLALFITLPYGKFTHATHRYAALLRYALERRHPAAGAHGD